jgi:hypothetical protein
VLPAIVEPFAVKSINRLLETAQTMHGLVGRDGRVLGAYAVRWPRRPSQQLRSQLAALTQASLLRDVGMFELFSASIFDAYAVQALAVGRPPLRRLLLYCEHG